VGRSFSRNFKWPAKKARNRAAEQKNAFTAALSLATAIVRSGKRSVQGADAATSLLLVTIAIGRVTLVKFTSTKPEENMTPTAWEFRNKLLATLSAARHDGKTYVEVESSHLFARVGGDSKSNLRMPICHDIMTKMMRPGDSILQETQNGESATMWIRYILKARHENETGLRS